MPQSPTLVLASSSRYRKTLLQRLGLPFEVRAPNIDETPLPGEPPRALALRLARSKAHTAVWAGTNGAGLDAQGDELVIGSDQVAVLDGRILGKPGSLRANVEQLRAAAGREVCFLTALCLLDTESGQTDAEVVPFTVRFGALSDTRIERYVTLEPALDCAGGFKCEGLGISLFEEMSGPDPTALVGLPLIALVRMLRGRGLDPLG